MKAISYELGQVIMQKAALIILSLLFVQCAYSDNARSKISENPSYIIERAREHVENKEYAIALKDYMWFFKNSTKMNNSLWAVKLSYCLNEWRALGDVYEPALKEFRKELSVRKERLESGVTDVWVFLEYNALCFYDGREKEAVDMFISFHNGKNKDFAKAIFPLIQNELGDMGLYGICSKYIQDPIRSFDNIKPLYDLDRGAFNKEMLFLLTVLWKNNRNIEYEQLKLKFIELNPSGEIKDKISEMERTN